MFQILLKLGRKKLRHAHVEYEDGACFCQPSIRLLLKTEESFRSRKLLALRI